jgi:hypothetical protein
LGREVGRPRREASEEDLEAIVRIARSEGVFRDSSMAKALGVDARTWRSMKKRDGRIRAALEVGKAIEEERLVDALFTAAMEGKIAPAIFLLKGRHGYREVGPADGRAPAVTVNITLPGATTPEQYMKLIDGGTVTVEDEIGPDHPLYDGP